MSEMNRITAILQLYSQVTDFFGNVVVKRINMRLFDLLAQFHYILNLSRITFRGNRSRPRAWCHSLCTGGVYSSGMALHSSREHGHRGVDIEDFWEGSVPEQGDVFWQRFGKFHFQSAVSFSLDIEGVVRIHLQYVHAITLGIVISDNVNVLTEGGQLSEAVYVLVCLVFGAKGLKGVRLTIDVQSQRISCNVESKTDFYDSLPCRRH